MALLKVTDASGRQWEYIFPPQGACTIGRAPDNTVVLDDPRASRYHAHVKSADDGSFTLVDGAVINGELRRSANKEFVNGGPHYEHQLKNGDRITIGASTLRFEQRAEERTTDVRYDDKPLGHTQLVVTAHDVMQTVLNKSAETLQAATTSQSRDKVLEALQRKANILSALYEMSKTLGSVFDLEAIFAKATDVIFRSTPADRVVALLAEGTGKENPEDVVLNPIAMRARDESLNNHARKLSIGRTITRKVMRDRVALLSQDAASDEEFAGGDSIVSQGVRSTICAPLVGESRAHGGTLDKYLGDGLMALFGAPTTTPEDASNALNAAVAMQRRLLGINTELRQEGLSEVGVGIGLHTGDVIVGYIGSERRSEYTAIGDAVNTASRLESNAKGGQILISDATAKSARSRYKLQPRDPITVQNC